ncbi:MAG: patatin-like phospholipase family protein [Pseudomonadota bacterium]
MNILRPFVALLSLASAPAVSGDPVETAAAVAAGERPRIGLVLSGGGARGAAHVGVLQVLKELRVPVDAVAGTSMGAVIGGLYAAGLEPVELEHVIADIDWQDAFRDRTSRDSLSFRRRQDDTGFLIKFDLGFNDGRLLLPKGIIQGQKLALILRELTLPVSGIDDFDELATPFRAVAADLATGDAAILSRGDLVTAMRASMSVPGVFTPVEDDGRLLVDGGLAKNLPIDVARAMGVDVVIAVDVGFPLRRVDELDSAVAIADQMLTILIRREADSQAATLSASDVLITPGIGDYSSTNFADVVSVIAPGAAATRAEAGRLAALALSEREYTRFVAARAAKRAPLPVPAFVRVRGDSPLSSRVIGSRLSVQAGEALDPARVADDAQRIYGLELFEHVDYSLVEQDRQLGLEYRTVARSWGPNYLRFGLSFEEDFEGSSEFNVGARYTRTAVNRLGAEWRTDLVIGTAPGLDSEFYQPLSFDLRYFVAPAVTANQRNIDVFDAAGAFARYRLSEAGASLAFGREIGLASDLRIGLRRSTGNALLRIGDAALPDIDFSEGAYFVQYRRDTFDDPEFPRSGSGIDILWERQRPELGADSNADLVVLQANRVVSFDRHTFAAGIDIATTEDGSPGVQNLFRLGGFLNLSGLDRGQIIGRHAGLARLIYYRRLGDTGGGLLDWPLYAGMSLEAGNVWDDRDEVTFESLRFNGSVFLGLDTFFGPLFLASGFSENGATTLNLFLGQPFR